MFTSYAVAAAAISPIKMSAHGNQSLWWERDKCICRDVAVVSFMAWPMMTMMMLMMMVVHMWMVRLIHRRVYRMECNMAHTMLSLAIYGVFGCRYDDAFLLPNVDYDFDLPFLRCRMSTAILIFMLFIVRLILSAAVSSWIFVSACVGTFFSTWFMRFHDI